MTLARKQTVMLVAACLMTVGISTQGLAQGLAKGHDKKSHQGLSIPIATVPGSAVTGTGTFLLQRFVNDGGTVKAVGIVTGTFTDGTRSVSVVRNVALPVSVGQATTVPAAEPDDAFESGPSDGRNATVVQAACPILHLDLGPLNLDLLGLVVDLSQVVLDITAVAGAGNLLGNLLCAVTGLLDNPAGLTALLNDILGAVLGVLG
jgi:hypothetical protein